MPLTVITARLDSELYWLSSPSLDRRQFECEEEEAAAVVAGRACTSLQHSPHMSGRGSSHLQRFSTQDELSRNIVFGIHIDAPLCSNVHITNTEHTINYGKQIKALAHSCTSTLTVF